MEIGRKSQAQILNIHLRCDIAQRNPLVKFSNFKALAKPSALKI
jgi:hypothetical protein